jgi:hypothetical protein
MGETSGHHGDRAGEYKTGEAKVHSRVPLSNNHSIVRVSMCSGKHVFGQHLFG